MPAYTDHDATAEFEEILLGDGEEVLNVTDAHDEGWMVPRGERLVVETPEGRYLITVQRITD